VVTLPSGLQYIILEEGKDPVPKETDSVAVHYKGSLIDGTEFDSSYQRGEPETIPVNRVIRGWTEALTRMKTGSKSRRVISALYLQPAGIAAAGINLKRRLLLIMHAGCAHVV